MSEDKKHTPLPWEVNIIRNEGDFGMGEDISSGFDSYSISIANGKIIADTTNSDLIIVEDESDDETRFTWDTVGKANAEFIVRACNTHYKLLDACKEVTEWFANKSEFVGAELNELIKAAIAKAEGK